MRRAEMARRRKNLSEKRNEEEKMDTINRLLKKQAPKRQTKKDPNERVAEGEGELDEDGNITVPRPKAIYTRYIQRKEGSAVSVPVEWIEGGNPIGRVFIGRGSGRLIEEVA